MQINNNNNKKKEQPSSNTTTTAKPWALLAVFMGGKRSRPCQLGDFMCITAVHNPQANRGVSSDRDTARKIKALICEHEKEPNSFYMKCLF